MSIRSIIGNSVGSMKDSIADVLSKTNSNLSGIVSASSILNTNNNFVGMNEEKMEELYDAIRRYIRTIEDIIDQYDYEEKLSLAYKGEIQNRVREFVESSKTLLKNYVSTLNKDIDEEKNAYIYFSEEQKSISKDVVSDAEDVRNESNKIKLQEALV